MKTHPAARDTPLTCFDCGAPVRTEWHDTTFPYGADQSAIELGVRLPVEVCVSCGAGSLGHEAAQIKHEAVCTHLGVLTPREVRAIREHHHLSRAAFAALTGLGSATLHRWENGLLIQNRANDRYLRLLRSAENILRLRQLVAEPEVPQHPWHPCFRTITEASAFRTEQVGYRLRAA